MKYFICALDTISIGIPAERTERIIPVTRVQTVVYETEGGEAFISVPVLLRQKNSLRSQPEGMHGIVLKPDNAGAALKTILLTPRIDIDMEMPEEDIHSLPEALVGLSRYFRGAYFTGETVILVLNTEKLTEAIV